MLKTMFEPIIGSNFILLWSFLAAVCQTGEHLINIIHDKIIFQDRVFHGFHSPLWFFQNYSNLGFDFSPVKHFWLLFQVSFLRYFLTLTEWIF